MHVVAMYVDPRARGLRCAHRLLDAIADLAIQRQAKRLVLDVAESNISAAHSYRAYGFTKTGRERPMDRDSSIVQIEFAYPLAERPGRTPDRQ